MTRLGGASAVAQLVADIPLHSVEVINAITSFCLTTKHHWKCLYIVSDNSNVRLLRLAQDFIVSSIF